MRSEHETRTYLCIDLKSFYASVECADRGLDPFTTNLVVADPTRTEKTICLAITPAMKALGISNRCRVFEIPEGVDYIMARPRMRRYMEASADIYSIYLRYISPDDIHVYSIDEVFIDATSYLSLYGKDARGLANMLMDAVLAETGIRATAGIGTNLFLAKVALDITAKHAPDNIGVLDEESFKRELWHHKPITDIWNIGQGIAERLAKYGVFDLAGVCDMNEETLYCEFGVNAEFLIDHAHGIEPCTMADIKAYQPKGSSLSNGQVLARGYTLEEARIVMHEMVDALVLELMEKDLLAESVFLRVGYEGTSSKSWSGSVYTGKAQDEQPEDDTFASTASHHGVPLDHKAETANYYRAVAAASTGGSRKLGAPTQSRRKLLAAIEALYDETTDAERLVRRLNLGFGRLVPQELAELALFEEEGDARERDLQQAILSVKDKFGKNALLRATSLTEASTVRERNEQVGGHHA